MTTTSGKKSAQWVLRFQSPQYDATETSSSVSNSSEQSQPRSMLYPIVAKFTDPVDWQNLTANRKDGIYMYYQNEELRDDENDEKVVKDSEFYKKRKAQQRQRRYYQKKQLLVFECPKERIFYEGKENNLDVAELERGKPSSSVTSADKVEQSSNGNSDFRYVFFKFVKSLNDEGEEVPEIHVIPVSSMYTLRKTGRFKDTLLSEIEERYVEEKKQLQKKLSKYQTIVNSLQRDRVEDSEGGKGKVDYVEDISESDLFKQALHKAFGHRLAKMKGNQGRVRKPKARTSDYDGEDGDFGGGDYVEFNDLGLEFGEAEMKEYREVEDSGDFDKTFADDEEDNVLAEQMELDANAENEISSSWRNDILAESSDEEEENDEENKEKGNGEGGPKSGIVDRFMLDEVDEAMEQYSKTTGIPKSKTAAKRPRDSLSESDVDYGITNDNEGLVESNTRMNAALGSVGDIKETEPVVKEKKRARISFAEPSNEDIKPLPIPIPIPSMQTQPQSSRGSSTSTDYDLSEEGVKSFINRRGGMVEIKVIIEAFKSKVKAYNKLKNDKTAGKQKLVDIIEKITVTIEDPIRGKCLSLK